MKTVRIYVHENGTFPRGAVTLPVVANLSKALSFVVTYTRIETHYLPSPYEHHCRDYSVSPFESRMDCISDCVRKYTTSRTNTMAWDDLLIKGLTHPDMPTYIRLKRRFSSPYDEDVANYEFSCSGLCGKDCVTKTFYTTLSETSPYTLEAGDRRVFEVNTRFENPETSVRFVPRLDFQAYVIYIAGVFGIWFSASIYHMGVDLVSSLSSGFKFVNRIH